MELLDLDAFDVDILFHASCALEAEARFERELALRLSLHGEWQSVRARSRTKREWAKHIQGLCAQAWRSRSHAELSAECRTA